MALRDGIVVPSFVGPIEKWSRPCIEEALRLAILKIDELQRELFWQRRAKELERENQNLRSLVLARGGYLPALNDNGDTSQSELEVQLRASLAVPR